MWEGQETVAGGCLYCGMGMELIVEKETNTRGFDDPHMITQSRFWSTN